jgi:hypothetical protein
LHEQRSTIKGTENMYLLTSTMKIVSSLFAGSCLAVVMRRPLEDVVETQATGFENRRIPQETVRLVQDQPFSPEQDSFRIIQGSRLPVEQFRPEQEVPSGTEERRSDLAQVIDTTRERQVLATPTPTPCPPTPCPEPCNGESQRDVKIEKEISIEFDSSRAVDFLRKMHAKESKQAPQTLPFTFTGATLEGQPQIVSPEEKTRLKKRGWYGGYWGSPNWWGGDRWGGGWHRDATLRQCVALANAQTTPYMRDAYLAHCSAYAW